MAFPQSSVGRFSLPLKPSGVTTLSSGSSGTVTPGDYWLYGTGSPEGVKNGDFVNQPYLDRATGSQYYFNGTPGNNTGWV